MTHTRVAVLLLACFVLLSASALAQPQPFTIGIRDACDPGTFNANVGPGTCKPGHHGTTKFKFFIGELQSDQIAGAWRFNPLLNATQAKFTLSPRSQASEADSFRHSISCQETQTRRQSACSRRTPRTYLLKPEPRRPDQQQARISSQQV